jgi:hypothetical protein
MNEKKGEIIPYNNNNNGGEGGGGGASSSRQTSAPTTSFKLMHDHRAGGGLSSTYNNPVIKIKGVGFNPGNDRLCALKITYIDEESEQP